MAYDFQTGHKTLYGTCNCYSKVLLFIESMLQNVKQLKHARLSCHVRCPSGIHVPSESSPAFAVLSVSIAVTILNFNSSVEVSLSRT